MLFLIGERGRHRHERPEPIGRVVRDVLGGFDPFPALGAHRFGRRIKLLVHELLEEKRIGEIAAPVFFEEIAHDKAARRFIGLDPHKAHARITGGDGVFGEKPADVMRGLKPASLLDGVPDLFLPRMIGVQGERHEKIERQGILFIEGEEFRAHACKLQALAHHGGRHAERGGNVLDALAFFRERGKGAELIERMQRLAVGIFGKAVLFLEAACLHKAGNGRRSSPAAFA